jgi:hypothetical protein
MAAVRAHGARKNQAASCTAKSLAVAINNGGDGRSTRYNDNE